MLKTVTTVVACACGIAAARPEIPYGNLSGSATTINFDAMTASPVLGVGETLTNQYTGQGATFAVPNYAAYATNGVLATNSPLNSDPNVIWVDNGGGSGGGLAQGIDLNFSVPVRKVGVWFGGSNGSTFRIAAYAGNTLLETVGHGLPAVGLAAEGFMAIERTELITRVVLTAANTVGQNWNFAFDDLKFEGGGGCYPDCNQSGSLTVADFGCFQTAFASGNMYADCNADGVLTVPDFGCFQTRFVTGCP